jgi:hypothetical protein
VINQNIPIVQIRPINKLEQGGKGDTQIIEDILQINKVLELGIIELGCIGSLQISLLLVDF